MHAQLCWKAPPTYDGSPVGFGGSFGAWNLGALHSPIAPFGSGVIASVYTSWKRGKCDATLRPSPMW